MFTNLKNMFNDMLWAVVLITYTCLSVHYRFTRHCWMMSILRLENNNVNLSDQCVIDTLLSWIISVIISNLTRHCTWNCQFTATTDAYWQYTRSAPCCLTIWNWTKLPSHFLAALPCAAVWRRRYAYVWYVFTAWFLLPADRQTDWLTAILSLLGMR